MTLYPDTNLYPSQGTGPLLRCRLSFDDASDPTPNWTEIANVDIRSFSVRRGRDSELDEFDAGTATVVFDNRDRFFDPNQNASISPLNRLWLYAELNGVIYDLFRGYVDSWELAWPGGGWSDAEATANCVDEFFVLSMMALPTTNPPRESYTDLVAADNPLGFWDMNENPADRVRAPSVEIPYVAPRKAVITAEEWGPNHASRADLRRLRRSRRKGH